MSYRVWSTRDRQNHCEENVHKFFIAPAEHIGHVSNVIGRTLAVGVAVALPCLALKDEPGAKVILCELHAQNLIGHATAAPMPLSALRSVDRKAAGAAQQFILVDRFMRLSAASAANQTAEFLPYVLAALTPYANRDVPGLIEIGGGCSLHIVPLSGGSAAAAMIVFIRTTALSAALRRAVQLYGLTPREIEVLSLLTEASSNEEIATSLSIALSTVSDHVHNLSRKMQCLRRSQVVRKLFIY